MRSEARRCPPLPDNRIRSQFCRGSILPRRQIAHSIWWGRNHHDYIAEECKDWRRRSTSISLVQRLSKERKTYAVIKLITYGASVSHGLQHDRATSYVHISIAYNETSFIDTYQQILLQ